jgi:uncharacterized OB-fold protein
MVQESKASAVEAEKKQKPIVPFLHLPDEPGEQPYLLGSKCGSCGTVFVGERLACARCLSTEPMQPVRFSGKGTLHVFSIVHQSGPGIPVPYIAAIVDLQEGGSVRCNLEGIDPDPDKLEFGMPVEMFAEKIREDREGNDVIAFKFRPAAK